MAREAFTTLADVKAWLGISSTESDAILQRLIYQVTAFMLNYLNRDTFLYGERTFVFDGVGSTAIMLPEWPVHDVTAVLVDGISMVQAPDQIQPGYSLQPGGPTPPGNMQNLIIRGYYFTKGQQNISVTCTTGYAEFDELHAAAATVTVDAPNGAWADDIGVKAVSTGAALVKVASAPAVGQYALGTAGQYIFNASQTGQLAISYSYVPSDLADACMELVSERFRYRSRIGERTKSLGGQVTASYDLGAMPEFVARLLNNYRKVVPC